MADTLTRLAADKTRTRLPLQAKAATIRTDAASDTDAVFVSFDAEPAFKRGPAVGWQARGARLPQVGDRAAVIETDDGALWVLAWWPVDA